jgi:DNA repair protein RadD
MIQLRPYQETAINKTYEWWESHAGGDNIPLVTMPTASGKSIVIAELARQVRELWHEASPRIIVIVPSKELAEQNAEKLIALLPSHIRVGFFSASLGQKNPDADVIVATIGSVYKAAHELGDIKVVVIDEAHLVSTDGKDAGRYRKFLTNLAKYCKFRVVGLTATPFRGNGVWLTEGKDPLFRGVAYTVKIAELLKLGFLAPLVRPIDVINTRIDTAGISTTTGDFNIGELSDRVESYLVGAADDACKLASDRLKWIAFVPSIANAHSFCELLKHRGITTAVVTGETKKAERGKMIRMFRDGELRCLVTVLALATGFDVPDVDCILWLRPTRSPVLYVQGAGRGMRIAEGKRDCLWLDFSDTTQRLGPVDAIKGRSHRSSNGNREAPSATCPECGEIVIPASLAFCPSCGGPMRESVMSQKREASNHAILASQAKPNYITHNVTNVTYRAHIKPDKPPSIRVDYWDGLKIVVSEWVCPLHGGFVTAKAQRWIDLRTPDPDYRHFYCDPDQGGIHDIKDSSSGLWSVEDWIAEFATDLRKPTKIKVNHDPKFPVIVHHYFADFLEVV